MLYQLLISNLSELDLNQGKNALALRGFLSFFVAFFITLFSGKKFISILSSYQNGGQPIREDGPESHLSKKGTPTMGGLLIIISTVFSTLLFSNLANQFIWIVLFVFIGYGFIGFVDDYLKVKKRNVKGVTGKLKIVSQFLIGLVAIFWVRLILGDDLSSKVNFSFINSLFLDIGIFYIPFALIVLIGSSNAVNLTDGLDGLVSFPVIVSSICFAIISYIAGDKILSIEYNLDFIPNLKEIIVIISALTGALLAFLYYNTFPAKLFMGDTGSLALGGLLGIIAIITKHEILFVLIGGLFVIEAFSVIIQVYYFKMTKGKRFFKMAPIHHHFEKLGWFETKVVTRFWILSVIFGVLGISVVVL